MEDETAEAIQRKDGKKLYLMPYKMSRIFCMNNSQTFSMKPVAELLQRYINTNLTVIDPFSYNSEWGTITNDINPDTKAQHHMHAIKFLDMLLERNIAADVFLLDPPYSPRQISECYKAIKKKVEQTDTQIAHLYKECKDRAIKLLKKNGLLITFSWNSGGGGINRGFQLVEILMIYHGGAHNDTIITVERLIK